jgi:hypothetical protein
MMEEKDLSKQIGATYNALRIGLFVIAFAFPPLLWAGGYFLADIELAGSMSAYYHATKESNIPNGVPGQGTMRNVFVGLLFATGALLFAYKGYSPFEDYALNLAATFAALVALYPMDWSIEPAGGLFWLHGTFAILFFACIGYVCIFHAVDTVDLIPDKRIRSRYVIVYRILGVAMVAIPLFAWFLVSISPYRRYAIFTVETMGIYVFATYWFIKGREARMTQVEKKAVCDELHAEPIKLAHAFRSRKITTKGGT